jgi:hypothetical protein
MSEQDDYLPGIDTPSSPDSAVDPYTVEPLSLPSGGKIEFRSMAKLTGDNLRWLRGVNDAEGQMVMYNEVLRRAIVLLVDEWTLTESSGRPLAVPREDRDGRWLKTISAFDLAALERHVRGPVKDLVGNDLGMSPGE